jgi:hypothetical protein
VLLELYFRWKSRKVQKNQSGWADTPSKRSRDFIIVQMLITNRGNYLLNGGFSAMRPGQFLENSPGMHRCRWIDIHCTPCHAGAESEREPRGIRITVSPSLVGDCSSLRGTFPLSDCPEWRGCSRDRMWRVGRLMGILLEVPVG